MLVFIQTGSGKTYTMGTGFDINVDRDLVGIIPRAVEHLFNGIDKRRQEAQNAGRPMPEFSIKAQFIEVWYCRLLLFRLSSFLTSIYK